MQATNQANWQDECYRISCQKSLGDTRFITSNKYQYTPLETPSTIRVIKIQDQKINNEVACIIRHVERTDFEYEALSYVWGNPAATNHVYLANEAGQEQHFPLHRKLWQFLNWAWSRQIFDRWIWTDRLGLNQEDEKEMAQQIPRMGEIFSNAKQVMAWLGMSTQDGEDVTHLIDHANSYSSHFPGINYDRGQFDDRSQLAANRVRGSEYWGRVWIVQEVCRAKRVVVLIGKTETDFLDLWSRTSALTRSLMSRSPIDELHSMTHRIERYRLWELLRPMTESGFKCLRPQDRVYGILGLVQPHDDGTSPTDHIHVDYERSASEVILDAVLECRTPWNRWSHIQATVELLLGKGGVVTLPIFELFERYLGNDKTSERHKELARYALQAFEASNEIFDDSESQPGLPLYWTQELFNRLLSEMCRSGFQPTIQESAVMTGVCSMMIVQNKRMTAMFEDWKTRRKVNGPTHSVWRCAEHMSRGSNGPRRGQEYLEWFREREDQPNPGTERYMPFDNKLKDGVGCWWLDPRFVVKACSKTSDGQSCDGTTMMFEIPEVGFRLALQLHGEKGGDFVFLHFRLPMTDQEEEKGEGEGR